MKKVCIALAIGFFVVSASGISVRRGYCQAEVNARITEMQLSIEKEQEFINALRKRKLALAKKKQRLQSLIQAESQKVQEIEAAKKEEKRLKDAEEAARKEAQAKAEVSRQEQAKIALARESEEKARIDKQIAELTKKYQELVDERKKLELEVQGEEENLKVLESLKNIEIEKRKKLEGQ